MAIPHKKPISELIALFQVRELAKSAAEREALTEIIGEMFASVGHPLKTTARPAEPPHAEQLPLLAVDTAGPADPPWLWLIAEFFSAIDAGRCPCPYRFDQEDGIPVLCVRTSGIMACVRGPLAERVGRLSAIRNDRALKKSLLADGVLLATPDGCPMVAERTVQGTRISNMVLLNLDALARVGLRLGALR